MSNKSKAIEILRDTYRNALEDDDIYYAWRLVLALWFLTDNPRWETAADKLHDRYLQGLSDQVIRS